MLECHEIEEFRNSLIRFGREVVEPYVPIMEKEDRLPEGLHRAFAEMNLLNLWLPEKHNGPGADLLTVCIAKEALGRVSLAASTLCANNSIGLILPIVEFGTDEQKEIYLGAAAQGDQICAVAITEPNAGSDVGSITTRAVKTDNGYAITGQKNWITWAAEANYILTFARTSPGRGSDGISAFLVPSNAAGLRIGKKEEKLGRHGAPTYEVHYQDCEVVDHAMVGPEGQAFKVCMRILDLNRPTVAASALGMAKECFDIALDYSQQRRQFGKNISQFQAIQDKIANMAVEIETSSRLLYSLCQEIPTATTMRASYLSSVVKYQVTESVLRIVTDAFQVFGAYGYSKEFKIERMYRDARLNTILEGTSEIHRVIIARRLISGDTIIQ